MENKSISVNSSIKTRVKMNLGKNLSLLMVKLLLSKNQKAQWENIEVWTNAFMIYASIFLEKHADQVQGIFKYMHTVRLAATRLSGQGWKIYDTQFRLRKAMNSWRWEPDRKFNFFNPPVHQCAVTYITEISLHVTLNNQSHSLAIYYTIIVLYMFVYQIFRRIPPWGPGGGG